MSLITLATAFSGSTNNVKHFMMRVHFMIEKVAAGIIKLEHIRTLKNHSDTLTKPLGVALFVPHTAKLLGGPQRLEAGWCMCRRRSRSEGATLGVQLEQGR